MKVSKVLDAMSVRWKKENVKEHWRIFYIILDLFKVLLYCYRYELSRERKDNYQNI